MRKLIQRGGIFFASMIFALAVGMTSAHGGNADQGGDHPMKCTYKAATDEVCFVIWGVELCRKRQSSDLECETVE